LERKRALWHSLVSISYAYLVSLLILSPCLYFVFMKSEPSPLNVAEQISTDLLNFVVPTGVTLVGGRHFYQISRHFTPGPGSEAGSYLGIPLLAMVILFALSYRSRPSCKVIVLGFIVVCVASLGPSLHIAGEAFGIVLPSALCLHFPLIDQVLPARLSMYSFLIAAIMAAIYLSDREHHWVVRIATGTLVILFLLPNPRYLRIFGVSRVDVPRFFRDGIYKSYPSRNDTALILPFISNKPMVWQAQTGMYFRMSKGYFGPDPPAFAAWPVVRGFRGGGSTIDFAAQLKGFVGANRVKAIVLDARERVPWVQTLSALKVVPVEIGDVVLYEVPKEVLVAHKNVSSTLLEAKQAGLLFVAGISAAQRYVAAGLPPSRLTPWEAERLRLLEIVTPAQPLPWDPRWQGDLWLGRYERHHIGVGVIGLYVAVRPIIEKFGRYADHTYFPFPEEVSGGREMDARGQLLMIFTPKQLSTVSSIALSMLHPETAPSVAK
jgi:hypothetical protein